MDRTQGPGSPADEKGPKDGTFDERDAEDCLDRARNGDREAFKAIVKAYERKVFIMAYSMLGNRDDALDAVQETFLRVYERAGMFKPGRSFGAWLSRVARNVCIDYYRRNLKRRGEWEIGQNIDDLQLAAAGDGTSSAARDLKDAFVRCIDGLAERQKAVFVMRHYEELQFNEISKALKISEGTAKSLHFKAVRNLKKRLTPFLGEVVL